MSREQSRSVTISDLLRRFERQIRRHIERQSGRAGLDDVFQETVAAALAGAERFEYRGDGQFLAWIYTISRRVMLQNSRKTARNSMRLCRSLSNSPGAAELSLAQQGDTPSSMAARLESCHKLAEAIHALPQAYREVIMLYRIEDRPLGEVAQILGKSKSATCHLLARAMAVLNEKLSE